MGDVDEYLTSLNLWRKLTARDGTSLYRAVAEQLLNTQTLHEQVAKACRELMEDNPLIEDELTALSNVYKCEFIVYQLNQSPRTVSLKGSTREVKLCKSDHYDSVYPVSFIEGAAVCQSIIYEVLYERVFQVDSVLEQSREMICNKTPNKFKGRFDYPIVMLDRQSPPSSETYHPQDPTPAEAFGNRSPFPTPFPYKVAKALMPDIYRNMEFDAWNETKRDQDEITCGGDGDQQFACGDKCQVNLEGHPERVFNAHIQEIKSTKGPVVVFVLELGERHEVALSNLIPLPQVHNQGWGFLNATAQQLDTPSKRRIKKKDFPLVVPVPGRQQSLPPRLCSQSSLGSSKEGSSDCSSPSGSMGRSSSPAGFQPRPRSNFVKRHLINSAGHLIKGNWAPMDNRWWYGRNRPPQGYFRFGRPEEDFVARDAYCHSPEYDNTENQTAYPEERTDVEISHSRTNGVEECGASSKIIPAPPAVYPSTGPNVLPSPCVFPSNAAPSGSSSMARGAGGAGLPPGPPPNYLASSPPYSYFIVPYPESMVGPVNYAALPSYDPSGMDLPQRDMSTLRFFFNLGIEYYRMSSYMQQQQHQQRFMTSFIPPVTFSVPIAATSNGQQMTSMPPPPQQQAIEEDSGQCAVVKEHDHQAESEQQHKAEEESFLPAAPPSPCSSSEHCSRCELPSSSQDSGCLSDIGSGHSDEAATHEEEEEEEEEEEAQEDSSSSSHTSSSSSEGTLCLSTVPFEKFYVQSPPKRPITNTTANNNTKSNKPVKLVRPIKDIPPRFKKLLEAANAQKTAAILSRQLEGLPLVRQLGPNGKSKQHVVQQPLSPSVELSAAAVEPPPQPQQPCTSFNPNAQSFVPGQPYEASDAAACCVVNAAQPPTEGVLQQHVYDHPISPYDHTMLLAPPPGPTYTIHIINGLPSTCAYSDAPPNLASYAAVSSGGTPAYAPSSPTVQQTYIHYLPGSPAQPPPPPMVPPPLQPLKTSSSATTLPAPPPASHSAPAQQQSYVVPQQAQQFAA